MIDKIRKKLDELHEKQNLVLRLREPPCCIFCSPITAQQQYNAAYAKSKRFVIEDVSEIKEIVIMQNKDHISTKCTECGAERVKEKFQLEKIYWVTCGQCKTKSLTVMEGICPICSEISKDAKAKFIKERGG